MSQPTSSLAFIVALWTLLSCADGRGDRKNDEPGPVGTAETAPLLAYVGSIELEPVAVLGIADGPPEYALGRITALVPVRNGRFFTCDENDTQVRLYEADGHFVRTAGRKGSGPGEYLDCTHMLRRRDGSLLVNDAHNARLVFFDADGNHVETSRLDPPRLVAAVDSAGLHWTTEFRSGRGGDERSWNMVVLRTATGTRVDSIELPSLRFPRGFVGSSRNTDDGMLSARTGDTIFAVHPNGGVLIARTDEYRVVLRSLAGAPREFARAAVPLRFRPDERRERLRLIEEDRQQPHLPLPEFKPIVRELRGDELGRVWVKLADTSYRRNGAGASRGGRTRLTHFEQGVWDIFNGDTGEFIGQVRLPLAHELLATLGDRLWLRSTGSGGELVLTSFDMRARVSATNQDYR